MNPHLSTDTTTPDTALIAKHAGWAAARAGKQAWIIDGADDSEEGGFEYTCKTIDQMRYVRKYSCIALRQGNTL